MHYAVTKKSRNDVVCAKWSNKDVQKNELRKKCKTFRVGKSTIHPSKSLTCITPAPLACSSRISRSYAEIRWKPPEARTCALRIARSDAPTEPTMARVDHAYYDALLSEMILATNKNECSGSAVVEHFLNLCDESRGPDCCLKFIDLCHSEQSFTLST